MLQKLSYYCNNTFIQSIKKFRIAIAIILLSCWSYLFYHRHISSLAIHNNYQDYWSGLSDIGTKILLNDTVKISSRQPLSFERDIIHWIHVSDIHINSYDSRMRGHFIKFLDDIIPLVNPSFVLATGDLTDGKDSLGLTTKQIESDWQFYSSQLTQRGYHRKDFWYDIPGNHDRFNVLGNKSPDHHKIMLDNETLARESFDYFKIYSVQKEYTYHRVIRIPGKNHSFGKNTNDPLISIIGLDSCPYPGPPRPSNFFGYITSEQLDMLESFIKESERLSIPPLHRIVLNHYPITTNMFSKTSTKKTFAELSKSIGLYLCGHLHDLGGIAPELYAIHPTGFAELEVSDMKSNGAYRLMTFQSNGQYSFSEHSIINKSNTIIHMITPKDSRFSLSDREKFEFGPWIEFLFFSSRSIVDIECKIGNINVSVSIQDVMTRLESSPLIYFPFDWKSLNANTIHHFSIQITDDYGDRHDKSFSFTLNGNPLPIRNFGHSLLHIRWRFFFQYLLIIAYVLILVVIMILPRIIDIRSSIVWSCFRSLSHWKLFYIPWIIYLAYVPLFPLFVGSFVPASESIFSVYVFGAYDHSATAGEYPWLPLVDTWDTLLFFTYSFTIPCLILLLVRIFVTSMNISNIPRRFHILFTTRRLFKLMVVIWWIFTGCIISLIWSSYGIMAFLISPGITWFYIWNTWVYFYANPPVMVQ